MRLNPAIILLILTATTNAQAAGPVFKVLYKFAGGADGANGNGTVFSLTPPATAGSP